MATIKQIAEKAGVSRGTVDRVLNNRSGVNEETARRVLEIARLLDYKPNKAGKALAAQKNKFLIGIMVFSRKNPYFDAVIRGFEEKAEELTFYGLEILIKRVPYNHEAQIDAIMAIESGMDSERKKKQENPTVIKETIIEKPAKATKKFKATTFYLIAILFIIIACLVLLLTSLNSMHKKNNEAQDQQISLLQNEISGMRATADSANTTKETTTEAGTTTKPAETTTKAPETTTKAPETTTKAPETTTSAPKTDAPVAGGYKTYTVQSGDYPFSILRKNGLEPNKYLQEFYRINGGKQSFSVGDVVNIPNS